MKKKYSVLFEPKKLNIDKEMNIFRRLLKEDQDLTKVYLMVYELQPTTATEIEKNLFKYFENPLTRNQIFYKLKKLISHNIISCEKICDIKGNSDTHKAILRKHNEFLKKIDENFWKRFSTMAYFYTTEYAENFVEFAARILNLKISKNDILPK